MIKEAIEWDNTFREYTKSVEDFEATGKSETVKRLTLP